MGTAETRTRTLSNRSPDTDRQRKADRFIAAELTQETAHVIRAERR